MRLCRLWTVWSRPSLCVAVDWAEAVLEVRTLSAPMWGCVYVCCLPGQIQVTGQ